jgi:hypothetical protein
MHWLSLLVSFLVGRFNNARRPSLKESAVAIIEEVTYKSRKPVAMILGGLACVLLLCGGFFMSLIDLTQQYDQEGIVRFTASFGSGLVLVALTLGAFIWIFASAWPGANAKERLKEKEEGAKAPTSSLEQALATLVMDFVKEREQKRELQAQHAAPMPPTASSLEKESPSLYN